MKNSFIYLREAPALIDSRLFGSELRQELFFISLTIGVVYYPISGLAQYVDGIFSTGLWPNTLFQGIGKLPVERKYV